MQKILILIAGILLGVTLSQSQELAFGGVPTEGLTDQQIYILTEILQDRKPTVNAKYADMKSFAQDYIYITQFLRDDIQSAVNICKQNKGADECNLYLRIQNRASEVQ